MIKDFEKFDDISNWLRDQWAGLFADLLSQKNIDKDIEDLSTQVSGLKDLSSVLKDYSEKIMEKLQPENFEKIIHNSNQRLRDRRIEIFQKEPLIEYLIQKSSKGIGTMKIYEALENSNDIEEFLIKAKFDKNFIKRLKENKHAEKDYDHIKRELFN